MNYKLAKMHLILPGNNCINYALKWSLKIELNADFHSGVDRLGRFRRRFLRFAEPGDNLNC